MNDTIALIVTTTPPSAKCISTLRKYNPISIGEIRKRIQESLPVLEYDAVDHAGLNKIIKCYSELSALGVEATFLDGGEHSSFELMKNLQGSYKQTELEVSELIDMETL